MNKEYEQEAVKIDELNLDKECIRLPTDYLKYAHMAANARRYVDDKKQELDVVEAQQGKRIRDMPAKYGIEKETEKAISSAIILQPEYGEAVKNLNEAKHEAEMSLAVVQALEHKKRSLTLLVELHGLGYFSSPKLSRAGKEAVDNMTKERVRRPFHRRED